MIIWTQDDAADINELLSREFFGSNNVRGRLIRTQDLSTCGRFQSYFMCRPFWDRWPKPLPASQRHLPTHQGFVLPSLNHLVIRQGRSRWEPV